MHANAIFYPAVALALWTALVLLLVPWRRVQSMRRGEVGLDDFSYGESAAVPAQVSLPNRNYMNLLEYPVLFYLACVVLHAIGAVDGLAIGLAWGYFGLRVLHSLVHIGYNDVRHRVTVFAASNLVVLALLILVLMRL